MKTARRRSTRQSWLLLVGAVLCVMAGMNAPAAADSRQSTPIPSSTPSTPKEYLISAINIIQENALYSDRVTDWAMLRRQAMAIGSKATTNAETYDAIRFVLYQLNDHHSFLMDPEQAKKTFFNTDTPANERFEPPTGKRLDGDLGYISLPSILLTSQINDYVEAGHYLLKDIAQQPVCGWVVDLRQDSGGNMYPMLAAVGPLLGDGLLGMFVDKHGGRTTWFYRKGAVGVENINVVESTPPDLGKDYSSVPVAVLTSTVTASSGEIVVISFGGRAHTQRFGFPTAGLTTANYTHWLSDGAAILLAEANEADRTGHIYEGAIQPDVAVKAKTLKGDPVLEAATAWLRQECQAAK